MMAQIATVMPRESATVQKLADELTHLKDQLEEFRTAMVIHPEVREELRKSNDDQLQNI